MVISINVLFEFLLLGFAGFSLFNWKSRKSNNPEFLFTEALHCLVKQDKKTAVSLLQKVVKKDTDHIEAYLLLGKTIRDEYPEQANKIHQSLTIRPGLSKSITIAIHKALAEDYKSLNSLTLAPVACLKAFSKSNNLNFVLCSSNLTILESPYVSAISFIFE